MYNYNELEKECLNYFQNDELATSVWISKYAMKDKKGNYLELDPSDMHFRMSKEFAKIEKKYGGENALSNVDIYNRFVEFKDIIPQGSVMSVLGNPFIIGSLSNCIVLPKLYDSYGGIAYADEQLTHLMKRRCGVGLDISTLRPCNNPVSNSAGTSTGAVSFMERFSNTTREVAQAGRRGALMITIRIDHPDIREFVTIKQDLSKVTGANISVLLTDEFMQAVDNNENYDLKFEGKVYASIEAKELWDTIISCAHNTAEPGLIFWDKQHTYSTSSIYPEYENISTNPCSEIAMGNDSCRLIAINLFGSVNNPFTNNASFDYDRFYKVCYEAQRLMDDLVDLELEAIERILNKVNNDPEPDYIKQNEIETWKKLYESGKNGRRTGLGFTGLGDTFAALGVAYDSDDALVILDNIMRTKLKGEWNSSIDMAIERGPFKEFNPEIDEKSEFIQMLKEEFPDIYKRNKKYGRRNISISTVAPTGSLSLLAQTTSGIEPLFTTHYIRRKKVNPDDKDVRVDFTDKQGDNWQEFPVMHPKLINWMHQKELTYNTNEEFEKIVKKSPWYNSCAPDINWIKRVELQAIVQKYTTHSISSTINLPRDVSTEEVSKIYMESWKKGLKGITVYRDGSRDGVLVTNIDDEESFETHDAPKRPKDLPCEVHHATIKGKLYIVVVGLFDEKPYEVFAFNPVKDDYKIPKGNGVLIKKSRGKYEFKNGQEWGSIPEYMNDEEETITRLVSTSLRHGVDIQFVVEQLNKTQGDITSFSKAVARTLKKYISDERLAKRAACNSCQSTDIIFEEGCMRCRSCGSSKCG